MVGCNSQIPQCVSLNVKSYSLLHRTFSTDSNGQSKLSKTGKNNNADNVETSTEASKLNKKKQAEDAEKAERAKNIELLEKWDGGPVHVYFKDLLEKSDKLGYDKAIGPAIENYLKLVKGNTLNVNAGISQSIRTFVLLQNPLLLKYKFDVQDFLKGAEIALSSVRSALCSQSLYNFANNIASPSHASNTSSSHATDAKTGGDDKAANSVSTKSTKMVLGKPVLAGNNSTAANENVLPHTEQASEMSSQAGAPTSPATSHTEQVQTQVCGSTVVNPSKATNDLMVDNSSADFLKEVLYPNLYLMCINSLREMNTKGIGFSHLPIDIDLHSVSVVDLDVRIINAEEHAASEAENASYIKSAEEEAEMLKKHKKQIEDFAAAMAAQPPSQGTVSSQDDGKNPTANLYDDMLRKLHNQQQHGTSDAVKGAATKAQQSLSAFKSTGKQTVNPIFNEHFRNSKGQVLQIPSFPEGSVVIDVKVRYEFTPVMDTSKNANTVGSKKFENNSTKTNTGKTVEWARGVPTVMEWVLSGCVSPHVPLEYKIFSFGY